MLYRLAAMRPPFKLVSVVVASAFVSAAACNEGSPASPPGMSAGASSEGDASTAVPFTPETASVYVPKVKNILLGLPATSEEVQQVQADPTQLKSLINTWMTGPNFSAFYQAKMLRFFQLAFQQTQISDVDFTDQVSPRVLDLDNATKNWLVQNATESFARTALVLDAQGAPLTQAVTTQQFMMTPALMELYAFLDAWQVGDTGAVVDRFQQENPKGHIYVEAAQGPIPIAESLDPTSPNYMHWYDPDVALSANFKSLTGGSCQADPIVLPPSAAALHYLLLGAIDFHAPGGCAYSGPISSAQLAPTDFTTWKMVTIRQPGAGESPTKFYDLPTLRATNELVLQIPRVGFFSTPAFFANWQTNSSNQMRVTTNQTLIVATGNGYLGGDSTRPPSTPGLDPSHDTGDCFSCHSLLDPTRSILAATYSWDYHQQADSTLTSQKGLFAFQGAVTQVSTIMDFANAIATHPLFAQAWVEKLCYYVNSVQCEQSDPEFQRVLNVFVSSKYSWTALLQEMLASPLTTYASPTQTAQDNGEVVAVERRDHLCAALNFRLGLTDACDLSASTPMADVDTTIASIAAGLPSDGYGRGAVAPVLPNQPTLFFRAGTENICEQVANLVIDVPSSNQVSGVTQWSSSDPNTAIDGFIETLMGLVSPDPRVAQAQTILQSHFQTAVAQGATPTAALQSTFVAACLAPSAVTIGL